MTLRETVFHSLFINNNTINRKMCFAPPPRCAPALPQDITSENHMQVLIIPALQTARPDSGSSSTGDLSTTFEQPQLADDSDLCNPKHLSCQTRNQCIFF